MEHQGMIWVWMDRAEGAEERAAANPPPFIPYLNDPNYVFDIGMMDLPYGYVCSLLYYISVLIM